MSDFSEGSDLFACAQSVERGDPERFAHVMAAPVPARAVLFPIYAFNIEVSRAPWMTQESMIAEMRLQWWRDALEEIEQGGFVRRHEVVTPLALTLDATSARDLDRVVSARRWDIYRDPFEDQDAFDGYLEDTGGVLMQVAARALGDTDGRAAAALGWATALAGFLRAVPGLEAAGRVPLVDGRAEAVAELAKRGLAKLDEARRHRGTVPKAAVPALMAGALTAPILKRAAQSPGLVAEGTLDLSEARTSARRFWVAATGRW